MKLQISSGCAGRPNPRNGSAICEHDTQNPDEMEVEHMICNGFVAEKRIETNHVYAKKNKFLEKMFLGVTAWAIQHPKQPAFTILFF